jgi:hypothetical protein
VDLQSGGVDFAEWSLDTKLILAPVFDLFKGFSLEKMTQIHQILKEKKSKSPDFCDKFQ